jgi:anti-sigma regulatory factor (Ser/Thr protein kinase)
MTAEGVKLTVAAQPENLAVVRQAMAGFAEAIGFDENAISNIKTIVTEAAMNAVVHAYPEGEPGPIDVTATARADDMEMTVRDHGSGFQPRPAEPGDDSLRLGLPLIAALSDGFEIMGGPGEGTEVTMRLKYERAANGDSPTGIAAAPQTVGTVMSVAPGELARPVLSRVIGALATRAELSIDRLSDTVLIGDAVSAHDASDFVGGTVDLEILDGDGRLDVRIGPLVEGASERILKSLELPGGTSLQKLASEVDVERRAAGDDAAGEYLRVVIDR